MPNPDGSMTYDEYMATLNDCECGHPWLDHQHGGITSTHCLHQKGCWDYGADRPRDDCVPCGCWAFKEAK